MANDDLTDEEFDEWINRMGIPDKLAGTRTAENIELIRQRIDQAQAAPNTEWTEGGKDA
jgi:hypothetical protein